MTKMTDNRMRNRKNTGRVHLSNVSIVRQQLEKTLLLEQAMALIQVSVWKRGSGDKTIKTYITLASNLITKICLYRASISRIRQLSVCCHGYTITMGINESTTANLAYCICI